MIHRPTIDEGQSRSIIDAAKTKFPGKPIKQLVLVILRASLLRVHGREKLSVLYPLIHGIGVRAAAYAFGPIFRSPPCG